MQLYNPFKPHIVQFNNGKYGVRKLSPILLFGWMYFDQQSANYWWSTEEYIPKYCISETLEKLKQPLDEGKRIV